MVSVNTNKKVRNVNNKEAGIVGSFGHRIVHCKSEEYPEALPHQEAFEKTSLIFEAREKAIEEGFIQESFQESWGSDPSTPGKVFERAMILRF